MRYRELNQGDRDDLYRDISQLGRPEAHDVILELLGFYCKTVSDEWGIEENHIDWCRRILSEARDDSM